MCICQVLQTCRIFSADRVERYDIAGTGLAVLAVVFRWLGGATEKQLLSGYVPGKFSDTSAAAAVVAMLLLICGVPMTI